MPRALVTLRPVSSSPAETRDTETDPKGRYEFSGLAPGEYTVWATAGEHRMTHLRQAFGEPTPMVLLGGPPRSAITLGPGQVRSDADIALARALAIEGRVLNPYDEPMADVEVVVLRANGLPFPALPVSTDDRGEYRLFGLSPGRYRVCATPEGGFAASPSDNTRLVRTCHLAAVAESNAADVMLDVNDATGIDIRVQPTGTFSVSGTVVDAAGALVDGGFIGASSEDGKVNAHSIPQSGQFKLTGLTPGRYRVHASIGGPQNPGDVRPPKRERELGYARIEVDGADVSGVHVQLAKGQTVAGRVVFDGRPAPRPNQLRMVVQMRTEQNAWRLLAGRPPYSAVNDALEFELRELYHLPLLVGISGLPEGWVVKSVRYDRREITNRSVDFGAGAHGRRIEIVLTNQVGRPTVRVTTDNGDPVSAYRLMLLPADPVEWKGANWHVPGTPSRDGSLKLPPVLPGQYLIAALSPEDFVLLVREPGRIEDLAPSATAVTLAHGEGQTINLRLSSLPLTRR